MADGNEQQEQHGVSSRWLMANASRIPLPFCLQS